MGVSRRPRDGPATVVLDRVQRRELKIRDFLILRVSGGAQMRDSAAFQRSGSVTLRIQTM
jgi:hypothetical protein